MIRDPSMSAEPLTTRAAIRAEIRTFVATWFRDGREEGIDDETPLVTSGIVDSAGVLEVVEFLERRFGVHIGDADISLRNCNTLQGLCELVAGRLSTG
jgi:acyl carrier protein